MFRDMNEVKLLNTENALEQEIHTLYPSKIHEYNPSFFKWHIYSYPSKDENI